MIKWLCILFLSVAPLLAAASERTIVVLGDSISAGYGLTTTDMGWVNLLQRSLDNEGYDYRVINESVSGDTTDGGLARIAGVLEKHRPEWVLIELGGNDALQGKGIDHIKTNLTTLCQKVISSGAQCALLTMRIPPNYGPRYAKAFTQSYAEVAEQLSELLVPFILDGVAGDSNMMQQDGIHPNEKGQPIIEAHVLTALKPHLNE